MPELSDSSNEFETYDTLFGAIKDGVYKLDSEGRITWINEQAVEEFDLGYSRNDLLGKHVSTIMPLEDVQTCNAIIQELLEDEQRESARCEIDLETKHGTTIPVELHLTVREQDGDLRGSVGVVRDITDRRQRQERLMVLTRLLRHNLRQKMNVIGGRLELVEDEVSGDERDHVEAIHDALRELTELSEKTLEVHWAMADSGRFQKEIDAVESVRRVTERLQDSYPTADISVEAPESAVVEADRTLDIVVENLLENALEHADRPSPKIEIGVSTGGERNARVTVTIADDGPGIPDGELEPLTEGRETSLRHGSGLGLWLVKWVVERFGGDLTFEDRTPRGTLVRVRLKQATDHDVTAS